MKLIDDVISMRIWLLEKTTCSYEDRFERSERATMLHKPNEKRSKNGGAGLGRGVYARRVIVQDLGRKRLLPAPPFPATPFCALVISKRLPFTRADAVMVVGTQTATGLTPRLVRGTMRCVNPKYWALSPAVGCALAQDQGLWANVRAASEGRTDGFSRLLRSLFFAPCHEAPIRRTRNESLPAAHLTPDLLGHIVGLGMLSSMPEEVVHARLRALGVGQLAKRTGVSISRFARLAMEFRAAAATGGVLAQHIVHPAHALTATLAWELCADREGLLSYLLALNAHGPVLADGLLAASAHRRSEWLERERFDAGEMGEEGHLGEAARLLLTVPDWEALEPALRLCAADAFELLAASSCATGEAAGPPEVRQARYGFNGQPARADCVEVVLRQLLDWLLWDPARGGLDLRRLPASTLPEVRAFCAELVESAPAHVAGGGVAPRRAQEREAELGQRWFELCARLRPTAGGTPIAFLSGSGQSGGAYELAPTLHNLTACLSAMLGLPQLRCIRELEQLPRLAAVPMEQLSVHVDRTWADREGFTVRLGEQRQLSVVLKEISNHAFTAHGKVRTEHLKRAARLFAAAWREGRLRAGPAWCLAPRLLPAELLVEAEADGRLGASRACAQMAVLSCRLAEPQVIAGALARECHWVGRAHARPRDDQELSWGGAGLLPMLATAAGRQASLYAPHAAATFSSASSLAQAARLLAADDKRALAECAACAPPLGALLALHSGESALLAAACRSLSSRELLLLLWPALTARRRARGTVPARAAPVEVGVANEPAPSSSWALGAVVLAALAERGLGLLWRSALPPSARYRLSQKVAEFLPRVAAAAQLEDAVHALPCRPQTQPAAAAGAAPSSLPFSSGAPEFNRRRHLI